MTIFDPKNTQLFHELTIKDYCKWSDVSELLTNGERDNITIWDGDFTKKHAKLLEHVKDIGLVAIKGRADLWDSEIESLPKLKAVGGLLELSRSRILYNYFLDKTSFSDFLLQKIEKSFEDYNIVQFAGRLWNVIGYNDSTEKTGVIGPKGTTTLLLSDFSCSSFYDRSEFHVDSSGLNGNSHYNGSDLQNAITDIYNSFTKIEKSCIVPRDLEGGSEYCRSRGYKTNKIAGPTATSQTLWPLSVKEAEELSILVRSFLGDWWLRSPGTDSHSAAFVHSDSDVSIYGCNVSSIKSVRPAFYLKLTSAPEIVRQIRQAMQA
jgi:hypothetical protein